MEKIQKEELLSLFDQKFGKPLPDELLELIAGGTDQKTGQCIHAALASSPNYSAAMLPRVMHCFEPDGSM